MSASPVSAGPADAATPARTAAGAPTDIADRVRQLDRDVNRVSVELARGAAAYEAAQARLARLTHDQFAARDDAEARAAQAAASRTARQELVRRAYKGAVPLMVTALLSGDPRAVSDLAYVRRSVDAVGSSLTEQALDDQEKQEAAGRALAQSDAQRRSALVLRQSVDAQLEQLVQRADVLTAELAATADELARARAAERVRARAEAARREAARRAADLRSTQDPVVTRPPDTASGSLGPVTAPTDGGHCLPPGGVGAANGFLSEEDLCPLGVGRGHRLRTDAARAFDRLNAARLASVGTPLCVTDSYRSYAAQVDVFKRKPQLAATPGRSQHGWGLAVDLCGGVQTFGTPAHEWMRAHAGKFGWIHPRWAQRGGSRPEAWHWEYVGGTGHDR